MKAAEKNRQNLSSSETRATNAKYISKKLKIDLSLLQDYIEYMEEDNT